MYRKNISAILKQKAKKIMNYFGLDKINQIIDLTNKESFNPISEVYKSHKADLLIKVPLDKCLHFSLLGFSCAPEGMSPFIKTLKSYERGECHTYEDSPLEEFYNNFQPKNVAEFIQMKDLGYSDFFVLPAAAALAPWMKLSPIQLLDAMKDLEYTESRDNGIKLSFEDGCRYYGPVTNEKGSLEYNRLVSTYESIKQKGFLVDRKGINNIKANILYSKTDNKWKAYVVSGQHRIAALTALGYKEVVIQIPFNAEGLKGIVREEDVKYWPGVESGYYSIDEASYIFRKVFEGELVKYI